MRRVILATALVLFLSPCAALAQERVCNFVTVGRTEQIDLGTAALILLHDPFVVRCSDGAELRATSGELDQSIRQLHLRGNVFFQDEDQTLTAEEAIYDSGLARLWASGNVQFVNRTEGSTLRGPELEYYRATETRLLTQVTATRRPHLSLQPRDRDTGAEPLDLVADRVVIIGEDDLNAFGEVVITRSDMRATGGEAHYDSAVEELEIRGDAVIYSGEYELAGDVVRARLVGGSIEHVHARTRAILRGDEIEVTAPDLELFFEEDLMHRAIGRSPEGVEGGRPLASSSTFQIEADSLDALFLDQRLSEVHAVGNARGETMDPTSGDEGAEPEQTARPTLDSEDDPALAEVAEAAEAETVSSLASIGSDWVRGDTIVGYFAPPAERESIPEDDPEAVEPSQSVELRKLVARGSAQSLYRMRAEGEPVESRERRNVNFLVGDAIELDLEEGELKLANVVGLKRGIYLEATTEIAPFPEEVLPGRSPAVPGSDPGETPPAPSTDLGPQAGRR